MNQIKKKVLKEMEKNTLLNRVISAEELLMFNFGSPIYTKERNLKVSCDILMRAIDLTLKLQREEFEKKIDENLLKLNADWYSEENYNKCKEELKKLLRDEE